MLDSNVNVLSQSKQNILHPATSILQVEAAGCTRCVSKAEGNYIFDDTGHKA